MYVYICNVYKIQIFTLSEVDVTVVTGHAPSDERSKERFGNGSSRVIERMPVTV